MNRLAKWMMRLYPARWRRRYGDELDALLSDTGADARVVADLLKGGVRMHFSTWSFAKLAVVLGIGGLLLGSAGSYLIAPIYESKTTLELTSLSAEPASTQLNSLLRQATPRLLSRTSAATIINTPQLDLYRQELKVKPLEDVIETMKNDVFIAYVGSRAKSATFQIAFRYPDPTKAREVTSTLARNFVDDTFHQRVDDVAGKHYLTVVDPPSLPVRPVFPTESAVLLVGCLLGAIIPFVWRRLRRKSIATWGFPVLVIVFGLAGLLAANIAFIVQDIFPYRYRSTATVLMQNSTPEQIQAIATDATLDTTLSAIINDRRLDLYKKDRKNQPLQNVMEHTRRNLAIAPSGQYVTISFEYFDRYKAQQTANAIVNRLYDTYRQTYASLPDEPVQPAPATLKVIDEASMPILPVSPNRYRIAMKGGLAGLLAAALVAAIRRRWKPESELPMDAVNG